MLESASIHLNAGGGRAANQGLYSMQPSTTDRFDCDAGMTGLCLSRACSCHELVKWEMRHPY